LRRGHGSLPVLSEVPHELRTAAHSKESKRSPQQFIPAGFPPHDTLQPGTENELSGQKQGLVSVRSPAAFWQVVNRNRLVSAL